MAKNNCYLYVYHGFKYHLEALRSIKSLKLNDSNCDIYVICPLIDSPKLENINIINKETDEFGLGYLYKISGISYFKENKFLFIDTDTFFMSNPYRVFEFINKSAICGVSDPLVSSFEAIPQLNKPTSWDYDEESMGEINTGVLGINRNKLPNNFFSSWIHYHNELIENNTIASASIPDQPSLIKVIDEMGIIPLFMRSEFNFRSCYPQITYRPIVIIHSHYNCGASFISKRPFDGKDVVITTPWGLIIRRKGVINRFLFLVHRIITKLNKNG